MGIYGKLNEASRNSSTSEVSEYNIWLEKKRIYKQTGQHPSLARRSVQEGTQEDMRVMKEQTVTQTAVYGRARLVVGK